MPYSIEAAKCAVQAITKVVRVNNTLQFISARHADIPKKVIFTQNLKSVEVYNSLDSYTLLFNYLKSSGEQKVDTDRVHLDYKFEGHNWEEEVKKVINETMRLV